VENRIDLIQDGKLNSLWPYTFSLVAVKRDSKMSFAAEDQAVHM
jgi:hypothetical protein